MEKKGKGEGEGEGEGWREEGREGLTAGRVSE